MHLCPPIMYIFLILKHEGSSARDMIMCAQGIKAEYEELDTVWFMSGSLFKNYPCGPSTVHI